MKTDSINKRLKILHLVIFLIITIAGVTQPNTVYAEELIVKEKTLVNAPAKAVWALVGGFKALDRWHPAIVSSTLLGAGTNTGDIRVLTLADNLQVVERLESYDEPTMTFRYQILDSPLPVDNYHASVSVKSAEEGKAIVIWQSSFEAVGISDDEAKQIINNIYLTGFKALTELFN